MERKEAEVAQRLQSSTRQPRKKPLSTVQPRSPLCVDMYAAAKFNLYSTPCICQLAWPSPFPPSSSSAWAYCLSIVTFPSDFSMSS